MEIGPACGLSELTKSILVVSRGNIQNYQTLLWGMVLTVVTESRYPIDWLWINADNVDG